MADILIALIPSVMWGSLVLVSEKLGGTPYNKIIGTTTGALIFSILISFYKLPQFTVNIFIISLISGVFWTFGQMSQFISIKLMGVSKALPISTGMCLISNLLVGIIVFKEWSTIQNVVLGSMAILLIIVGVFLISHEKDASPSGVHSKAILNLFISTVGFVMYVAILRYFQIDGWIAILPQAIGMLVTALLLTIKQKPYDIFSVKNIITGIIWASGNIGLLIAVQKTGIVVSYSLSQTGIIISTLGGIYLLGEAKSKKQVLFSIGGCILVILGGVFVGLAKT